MIKEYRDHDITHLNSFAVAARAERFVEFGSGAELAEYLGTHSDITSDKWALLGGGNNILFTGDFRGTLLHPTGTSTKITDEGTDSVGIRVEAGHDWDEFVSRCVGQGLWGVENLSHIPGTVGAAPVQNVGAYGAEVGNTIESVEVLHVKTLKTTVIDGQHCSFGYRDSIFKRSLKGEAIITAVNFRLSKKAAPDTSYGALREEAAKLGGETLENIRQAVINIRAAKLPDPKVLGNAGSFFKNPVVCSADAQALAERFPTMPQYPEEGGGIKLSAGWLIEQAGWKGRREGNVGVYDRQALFIINYGGATGAEIIAFSERVGAAVGKMFGVKLVPEVNIW